MAWPKFCLHLSLVVSKIDYKYSFQESILQNIKKSFLNNKNTTQMISKNTSLFIVLIAEISVAAMANFLPDLQAESNHQNRLLTSFPYPGTTIEGKREISNVAYSRKVKQGCDNKYSAVTSG